MSSSSSSSSSFSSCSECASSHRHHFRSRGVRVRCISEAMEDYDVCSSEDGLVNTHLAESAARHSDLVAGGRQGSTDTPRLSVLRHLSATIIQVRRVRLSTNILAYFVGDRKGSRACSALRMYVYFETSCFPSNLCLCYACAGEVRNDWDISFIRAFGFLIVDFWL